jgi:pimeloyl-ACP methyl ester carboxylesterase
MKRLFYKAIGLSLNIQSVFAPKAAGKRIFRVFCTPPKAKVREKEMQFLQTAQIAKQQIQGLEYTTFTWGTEHQDYLLLAYGWAYNSGRWRHFVPEMVAKGYRVIAFDPPGHGLSSGNQLNLLFNSNIIRTIIEQNGKPEAIVAHSFGGTSAIYALSKMNQHLHPNRFALMASFSSTVPIFQDFQAILGANNRVFHEMVRYAEELLGASLDTVDAGTIVSAFSHIEAMIFHDPKDPVTPFVQSERYHAYWKNSVLVPTDGGGHHLGTAAVTQQIIAFSTKGAQVLSV